MNEQLLDTTLAILLPIAFGWALKRGRIFKEGEVAALRKFVVRVALPFLIFQNLYRADVESLRQALPVVAGFVLLTSLYTLAARLAAPRAAGNETRQLTFAFAVFAGNYAFLGWGVIASYFGPKALTRAVFFSMFFWPVFLTCGFLLRRRFCRSCDIERGESFFKVLVRHAGVPMATAALALSLNIGRVRLPAPLGSFIGQFAALAIPMILFAIGQNLRLLMPADRLRLVLSASFFRLAGGFALGLAVVAILRLLFDVDALSRQVILLQAVMPTATMATFFGEYVPLDEELLSGIIAVSTLLSFVTLPLWVMVIRALPG
ncbi:MAG: AEC family transporter [Candidatus Aminicenantes bacterium]|nr:AEC family transporter [Candidatus Aminicenantes bacterium]